jgi:hypothetical protein
MRGGEMTSLRIATMEGRGGESRTDEGDKDKDVNDEPSSISSFHDSHFCVEGTI